MLQPLSSTATHHACVYCRAPLGSNEPAGCFPFGRRLAFDQGGARLWVICDGCRRWSLSALRTRTEIIEECERLHSGGSPHRSSENVSHVRHPSGVDLIRVDRAPSLELAAWRYGGMLAPVRWTRWTALLGDEAEEWLAEREDRFRGMVSAAPYFVGGLGIGLVSAAPPAQAAALGLVLLAFFTMFTADSAARDKELARRKRRADLVLGRIVTSAREPFLLHADQALDSRLVASSAHGGWFLSVPTRGDVGRGAPVSHEVEGREAVRALRLALSETNRDVAGTSAIRSAINAIDSAGGAAAFMPFASAEAKRLGLRYATLGELPRTLRVALEIAADEAHERSALEGDTALLDREWREAAELATLARRPPVEWSARFQAEGLPS